MPGEAATHAASLCPAPYDATSGNLTLDLWELDDATAVPSGALGAQVAQASSAWDDFARGQHGAITVGFIASGSAEAGAGDAQTSIDSSAAELDAAGDAGEGPAEDAAVASTVVASDVAFGQLAPTKLALVSGVTFDGTTSLLAQVANSADSAVTFTAAWPLPIIPTLDWPATPPDAGALRDGAGFVFVLLGDPNAPPYVGPDGGASQGPDAGGAPNARAPRVLALRTSRP
jgi:hypothetical protein